MGKLAELILHPTEARAAIQLKIYRISEHPRIPEQESANLRRCFGLLNLTSRSFAAVINELNPELRVAVMIFYLILRGLDTVEDDMTIDSKIKVPLLRSFDEKLEISGWTFNGNAPTEKDRLVLVEFDKIIKEYSQLKPQYKEIIKDITHKMGNGMADYICDENFNLNGVATVEDYDLYCYYVAGLVGVGMTNLFVALNFANDKIAKPEYLQLTKSMGLFLQKTNIIRDYREDLDDGRSFWPKEIWGKYSPELKNFIEPENQQRGLECISELVLNSLGHVKDTLIYLSLIEEPSAYEFCVIPQVMAIATLELVFQNPDVFVKNVKIRKGETCKLILKSRTYEGCIDIFREYIRKIHHKCPVQDSNYLKIGIKCGEIEQFIESLFIEKYMPKGAKLPEHDEIYNDVKNKIKLDDKIKHVFIKERNQADRGILGAAVLLFAIVYQAYFYYQRLL